MSEGRRPVGPGSQVCILLARAVSRGLNLESNPFGSLLLLADNYNPTTDDPTTEAQSAQRLFNRAILCSLQLSDSCELSAASPDSHRAMVSAVASGQACARGCHS